MLLEMLGKRVFLDGPARLLELYRSVFSWFVRPDDVRPHDLEFRITPADHDYGLEIVRGNRSESLRFASDDRVFGFVYGRILDEITRLDPGLLCVHGAALGHAGRGIAIAAPSNHGKSTLTLALTARGYDFLSDEVAAIDRDNLELRPFPMAVGCREGTFALLRDTVFAGRAFEPQYVFGKLMFDPSATAAGPIEPVRLHAVFFLEPDAVERHSARTYRLTIEPPRPGVESALAAVDGVAAARRVGDGGAVEIEVAPGAWVAPEVERRLAAAGAMVTTVEDLDAPAPDFAAEPVLTPLTVSDGVLSMFRHLRGFGAIDDLAAATPGGFGALLIDVASTLAGVGFYRLSPGRLPALIDRIESATTA